MEDLSADDKIVRLVTENNLHLRQCLHPRAFQHDIELSDVFFQFFDIRKEYKAFSEKSIPFKNLREIAEGLFVYLLCEGSCFQNLNLFTLPFFIAKLRHKVLQVPSRKKEK